MQSGSKRGAKSPLKAIILFLLSKGTGFLKNRVAERVGFEPTVGKPDTRSPGAPDRPLQHLSVISTQAIAFCLLVAERVGFEPTLRYKRRPLFESGTINHSDTSPDFKFYPKTFPEGKITNIFKGT